MKVLINKLTNIVEGIDSPSTPFNYTIDLEDCINPTKTVEEQQGEIQKLNVQGEPLFKHEVFQEITKEIIVGQDEVLEDTGVPVMINVQKTNEEGRKLYLEAIYNEANEIVDYLESTKLEDEYGVANTPIIVTVQKTSINGKPLFYKDIIQVEKETVLDHVEEVIEPIIDGKKLEPIMLPNIVNVEYDLKSNYKVFNGQDILEAKYQHLLEESQNDYIVADMFINESDLDLADPKHTANTGVAYLELMPRGQAKTQTITLATPSTEFTILDFVAEEGVEIYLSGKKFTNNVLTLVSPITNCTIKFVNTTDTPKIVTSYAIGY